MKLTEVVNKTNKVIAVFSGRFQPFHRGHYDAYMYMVNKFGKENVYIGTSNVVDPPRSPFTFVEKKKIMTTMFKIPSNRIVQIKNPYKPEEILKKFDKNKTAYVAGVSQKDKDRLSMGKKHYFIPYRKSDNLKPLDENGYVEVIPSSKFKTGGENISGTKVRQIFSSTRRADESKKKYFEKMYGKFDKSIYELIIRKLSKLQEGGAYGHMAHPFDDWNLTFGDLKKMIELGLSGELKSTFEKMDGQNFMVSWKNGKLIAARNKGHIKNFGANALDLQGIISKFEGRGEVLNAFKSAMEALEQAIKKLNANEKKRFFENGKNFLNLEVIYPGTTNVIPYGGNFLIFHGIIEYDAQGNPISSDTKAAVKLQAAIKKINADVQNDYAIKPPQPVQLMKAQNFSSLKAKYISKINALQKKFSLSDNDRVLRYHTMWWEQFIVDKADEFGYDIPSGILYNLINRWALFNKSYSISKIKGDIDNKEFSDWVGTFDKTDFTKQVKQNIQPFETIFLSVATDILKNVKGLLALSPEKAAHQIRTSLEKDIKTIQASDDVKKIELVNKELKRLEAAGGFGKLAPTEGIVFVYKGKTYKLTGTFAPINQLLGIIKFSR